MNFYDATDFIGKHFKNGCYIFEGTEDKDESVDTDTDATEEKTDETKPEPEKTEQEADKEGDPAPEPPEDVPTPDETKQNTPETVNTDDQSKGKESLNADMIVKKFKESGALKTTIAYAVKKIGTTNNLKVDMLKPYIKAAVEKFCSAQSFSTTVPEMAKAIMALTQSLGVNHVQKERMKAKKAEAAKQAEKQEPPQQKPADVKVPPEPTDGANDDGGEEIHPKQPE